MMKPRDDWGAFVDAVDIEAAAEHPGPLAGVRLAVKDNIAVAGLKWTAGLPLLAERRASRSAPCVTALEAAGASLAGTVATDAAGFGMMTPGVKNPLDSALSVGGSSGGSAAAVAAGLADLALGTDTAGSVRVPAACCGLFGLKPSRGAISTEGVTPLSTSFDHVGLLAADLGLVERAAAVLLGRRIVAPPLAPLVIGHDPSRLEGMPAETVAAIRNLHRNLMGAGHRLVAVRLPEREPLSDAHGIIVCREALAHWRSFWPRDAQKFGETARRSLAYAETVSDADGAAAEQVIEAARRTIGAVLNEVDVLIGPTLRVAPPVAGARRVRFGAEDIPVVRALLSETCPFNVSGHPALAMPLAARIGRVPVSLQLASRDDMQLIAIARTFHPAAGTPA